MAVHVRHPPCSNRSRRRFARIRSSDSPAAPAASGEMRCCVACSWQRTSRHSWSWWACWPHGARPATPRRCCSSFPGWLVLAKLFGLYDRDHRSLRHLTVDDLPTLAFWSLAGSAAMTLVLITLNEPEFIPDDLALLWVITTTVALVFRGAARSVFRRITPRERALIVGDGPLADAARRKLDLFPDIHVELVGQTGDLDELSGSHRHATRRPRPLGRLRRYARRRSRSSSRRAAPARRS